MARALIDRIVLALLVLLGVDATDPAYAKVAAAVMLVVAGLDAWARWRESHHGARAVLRAAELPAHTRPCEDAVLMDAIRRSGIAARLLAQVSTMERSSTRTEDDPEGHG